MNRSTVAKHNTLETGIWVIIDDVVYDITDFIANDLHPGTTELIKPYFGKDATVAFKASSHPHSAWRMLREFQIGTIAASKTKPAVSRIPPSKLNAFVSKIFIYPVKGCKGIELNSVRISHSGLRDDRIYAICNRKTGTVVNQLRYPQLSQVRSSFLDPTCEHFDDGIKLNDIAVPLINNKESEVSVQWKSCSTPILAYNQGERINKWITDYIGDENGAEFMLIRVSDSNYRTAEDYYKISGIAVDETSKCDEMSGFQNYHSVLLASQESLDELNAKYDKDNQLTWEAAGFRMNIIVRGLSEAHYEDFMKHIVFKNEDDADECEILWSRRRYFCAVPQVNQTNGEMCAEPMQTASKYRGAILLNDRTALPGDRAVFFGSFYAIKKTGVVHVGQDILSVQDQLDGDRLDYKSVLVNGDFLPQNDKLTDDGDTKKASDVRKIAKSENNGSVSGADKKEIYRKYKRYHYSDDTQQHKQNGMSSYMYFIFLVISLSFSHIILYCTSN